MPIIEKNDLFGSDVSPLGFDPRYYGGEGAEAFKKTREGQRLGLSQPEGEGFWKELGQGIVTGLGRVGSGISETIATVAGDQGTADEIRRKRQEVLDESPWLKPVDYGSVWKNLGSGSWWGGTIGSAFADTLPYVAGGIAFGAPLRALGGTIARIGATEATTVAADAAAASRAMTSAASLSSRVAKFSRAGQRVGSFLGQQVGGFSSQFGENFMDLRDEAARNGIKISVDQIMSLAVGKTIIDNMIETSVGRVESDLIGKTAMIGLTRKLAASRTARESIEAAAEATFFGKYFGSNSIIGNWIKVGLGEGLEEGLQYINESAFMQYGAGKKIDAQVAWGEALNAMAGGFAGGIGLGGVSSIMRVKAEERVRSIFDDINDKDIKNLQKNGYLLDEKAIKETEDYFIAFAQTVPESHRPIVELIKNASFKMAAMMGSSPESYVKELRTVFIDETKDMTAEQVIKFKEGFDRAIARGQAAGFRYLDENLTGWNKWVRSTEAQYRLNKVKSINDEIEKDIMSKRAPIIRVGEADGDTKINALLTIFDTAIKQSAEIGGRSFVIGRDVVLGAMSDASTNSLLRDLYMSGVVEGVDVTLADGKRKAKFDIRMTNGGIVFNPSKQQALKQEIKAEAAAEKATIGRTTYDMEHEKMIAREEIRTKKLGIIKSRIATVDDFFRGFLVPTNSEISARIDSVANKLTDPKYAITDKDERDFFIRHENAITSRKEIILADRSAQEEAIRRSETLNALRNETRKTQTNLITGLLISKESTQRREQILEDMWNRAGVDQKTGSIAHPLTVSEEDKQFLSSSDIEAIDAANKYAEAQRASDELASYREQIDGVANAQEMERLGNSRTLYGNIKSRMRIKKNNAGFVMGGKTVKLTDAEREQLLPEHVKMIDAANAAIMLARKKNEAMGLKLMEELDRVDKMREERLQKAQNLRITMAEREAMGEGVTLQAGASVSEQKGGKAAMREAIKKTSKGAYFGGDTKLAIFFSNADAGTVIHEWVHHVINEKLMPDSLFDVFKKTYATDDRDRTFAQIKESSPNLTDMQILSMLTWTTVAEENMANAFIMYARDAKIPSNASPEMVEALKKMKSQLKSIYTTMKETRFADFNRTRVSGAAAAPAPATTTTTPAAAPAGTAPAATTTAAATPAAQALKIPAGKYATGVTFTTERGGSVYTVLNDGTTIRVKGASLGHTDAGEKPASTRTVYVDEKTVNIIDGIYAQGLEKFNDFTISEDGTITYNYWHGRDKSGNLIGHTAILKSQASPAVGLYPVELLPNNGKHIGTAIANINQASPASAPSIGDRYEWEEPTMAVDSKGNKVVTKIVRGVIVGFRKNPVAGMGEMVPMVRPDEEQIGSDTRRMSIGKDSEAGKFGVERAAVGAGRVIERNAYVKSGDTYIRPAPISAQMAQPSVSPEQGVRLQADQATRTGAYQYSDKDLVLNEETRAELDSIFSDVEEDDMGLIYATIAAETIDDSRAAQGTDTSTVNKQINQAADMVMQQGGVGALYGSARKAASRVGGTAEEQVIERKRIVRDELDRMGFVGIPVENISSADLHRAAKNIMGRFATRTMASTAKAVSDEDAVSLRDKIIKLFDAAPRTLKAAADKVGSSANAVAMKNRLKWLGRNFITEVVDRYEIIDALESESDGPLHSTIGRWLSDADKIKSDLILKFENRINELEKDYHGGFRRDLSKTVALGGVRHTIDQAVAMYIHAQGGINGWQDLYAVKQIMGINEISEAEFADAIEFVKKDKGLMNLVDMSQRFGKEIISMLEPVAEQVTGEKIGRLPGLYLPLVRAAGLIHDGDFMSMFEKLDDRGKFRRRTDVENFRSTSMLERSKDDRLKGKVDLNFTHVFTRYYQQAANYIGSAPAIKNVMAVMANEEMAQAFGRRFGMDGEVYKGFIDLVRRDLTVNGRIDPYIKGEGTFGRIARNAYAAFMSWNPGTWLNQTLSLPAAFAYIPAREMNTAIKTFASIFHGMFMKKGQIDLNHPIIQMVREKAPHLLRRMPSQSMEEWVATHSSTIGRTGIKLGPNFSMNDFIQLGTIPMTMLDMSVTIATWYSAYKSKMTEGSSNGIDPVMADRVATEWANKVVRSTQNPSLYSERGLMQTSNEYKKSLIPFSGQGFAAFKANMTMIWPIIKGYEAGGWSGAAKAFAKEAASPTNWKKIAFYNMIPAFLFMAIARRGIPDKDDLIKGMIMYPFLSVPVIGNVLWGAAFTGYVGGDNTLMAGAIKNVGKISKDLLNAPWKGISSQQIGEDVRGVAQIVGLPLQPVKMVEAMIDGMTSATSLPDTKLSSEAMAKDPTIQFMRNAVIKLARELK